MTYLPILALLTGAVVGMRFKILAVLPLAAFAGVNTLVIGLILGESVGSTLLSSVAVVLALQGGYLLGSLTRWSVAAARTSTPEAASLDASIRET